MLLIEDAVAMNKCAGRIVVGFSGGIDSLVLLDCVSRILTRPVYAIHINHGLHSNCDEWAQHCARVCAERQVSLKIERVSVSGKGNLEANARTARYAAFKNFLEPTDLLLLAHHQDDQIETVLLHLMRGDSPFGLKGMPRDRQIGDARLVRPFLQLPRHAIEDYARRLKLTWVEDGSNRDTALDRNYLRHEIIPGLKARWPKIADTLLSALHRTDEGMQLIDDTAVSDLQGLLLENKISLAALQSLPEMRQRNLLRAWLSRRGALSMPGDRMLSEGLGNLTDARVDAAPLLSWKGLEFRRFDGHLYLTPGFENGAPDTEYQFHEKRIVMANGIVTAELIKGRGLRAELGELSISFRQGGETIRFNKTRSLKNIFQEKKIPAFLRDHIPLIYLRGELVGICGIPAWNLPIIIPSNHAASDSEVGWRIDWWLEQE
ncbi:MAG: tRNA lysidine(34) synthetase TilS [bacterium]